MAIDPGAWRTRLDETRVFASPGSRRRFLVHLLVAGAVLVVVAVLAGRHLGFLADRARARTFVRQFGVWSPLVLIGLQASR